MPAKAKSSANGGFLSSTTILIVLVALTGVSVASYHQYPEKVQAVYEFLPPQVRFLDSSFYMNAFFLLPVICSFFVFYIQLSPIRTEGGGGGGKPTPYDFCPLLKKSNEGPCLKFLYFFRLVFANAHI